MGKNDFQQELLLELLYTGLRGQSKYVTHLVDGLLALHHAGQWVGEPVLELRVAGKDLQEAQITSSEHVLEICTLDTQVPQNGEQVSK
jgi:hypothetical protein